MAADSMAGIVLCGGRSRRMGRDKAWLEIDGETLVMRVTRATRMAAGAVIVAAAPEQQLPMLDAGITVVRDRSPHGGPLAAVVDALSVIPPKFEWFYLLAVDIPFLSPRFLTRLAELRDKRDAVVPFHAGRRHPLVALYRRSIEPVAVGLIASGRFSMHELLEAISVREIHEPDWAEVDPHSRALVNWNSPEDAASAGSDARE
jgi:molybdopterin-guanine dinucleotide biosynthesis protein A